MLNRSPIQLFHTVDPSPIVGGTRFRPRHIGPPSSPILGEFEGAQHSLGFQPVRVLVPCMVPQTAPRVIHQTSTTSLRQTSSCWVEIKGIRSDPEVIRITIRRVDRDGLLSALEHMTSPQPPTVAFAHLAPAEQESFPVLVILNNQLPAIPTGHQAVNRSRVLVTNHTRHAQTGTE